MAGSHRRRPPIAWDVVAWLGLASDAILDRAAWDHEAAALAERAGADGWDAESLDESIADMERALRRGRGAEVGWISYGHNAYQLRFTVDAPTRAKALEEVRRRCVAPDGCKLEFEARPARCAP